MEESGAARCRGYAPHGRRRIELRRSGESRGKRDSDRQVDGVPARMGYIIAYLPRL